MLRALPEHPGLAVEIAETGLHLRMTGVLGPALEVITDRLGCPQPALPTRAASPADAIPRGGGDDLYIGAQGAFDRFGQLLRVRVQGVEDLQDEGGAVGKLLEPESLHVIHDFETDGSTFACVRKSDTGRGSRCAPFTADGRA
ncbi:hypothetical protein DC74_670 [Streptomyces noursei]|nr:hypothetical protein DC74_670 [Streptomyces noursei]